MSSSELKKEIEDLNASVKKLGSAVRDASDLWKDNKYQELDVSIGRIAKDSKNVIVAGDNCCKDIERFNKIASEEY